MTWDKLRKYSRPRHMPKKTLLFALALLVPTLQRAEAAAFACSGPIPDLECSDRELVGLDRAVVTEFDAIIRHADPLTNLLLRRDQDCDQHASQAIGQASCRTDAFDHTCRADK